MSDMRERAKIAAYLGWDVETTVRSFVDEFDVTEEEAREVLRHEISVREALDEADEREDDDGSDG